MSKKSREKKGVKGNKKQEKKVTSKKNLNKKEVEKKMKGKKSIQSKADQKKSGKTTAKTTTKAPGKTKKKDGIINLVLGIILVIGVGWLIYNTAFLNKKDAEQGTIKITKTEQVESFIKENGELLFQESVVEIKTVEKENGLWRAILDIDGQLQDFYMTPAGQIVQGVNTIKEILKSDKDEVIGDLDENGEVIVNENLTSKIKEFVETNLVQEGAEIEVTEVVKEFGLIKAVITFQGQEQPLYLTADGQVALFGVITIEELKESVEVQGAATEKAATVEESKRTDKPVVEYFVMSYCPYGTQFEKGIIPALKVLGDKIDAKMKFVSYVMHDKEEIDENLTQYCIQEEQGDKFYAYMDCFLESEDSKKCIGSTNVDAGKLATCVKATDEKFSIMSNYKNKSTWKGQFPTFDIDKDDNKKYSVGGSPTFVVNGQTISTSRDSQSLLNAICSAFNEQPEECTTELSSAAPSPGFGSGEAANNSSAGGCGE